MSKSSKRSTERRQFWQMAIETHRESGLSVRRFCENEGLNSTLFYSWRKRLCQDNASPRPQTKASANVPEPAVPENSPRFIEVSMPAHAACVELVLCSGNTLKFHPAIDKKSLANICSVLGELKLC